MKLTQLKYRGQGGFGIVHEVKDEDDKMYARKTFQINQGPNFDPAQINHIKKRFRREVKIQQELDNKNVVPVVYSDLKIDPPFYLMPLADNSLEEDFKNKKLNHDKKIDALMDIMAGLEAMHKFSIWHRDLKPGNVLRFGIDPSTWYYAISDFGLASLEVSNITTLTSTNMAKTSDYYTAPEIHKSLKNASAASDIYSLGCIIHDMFSSNQRIPTAEIKESGAFGQIMRNCTRTDPTRRFKSVARVRESITNLDTKEAQTLPGKQIQELLKKVNITKEEWKKIIDFIEDCESDFAIVLSIISTEHLENLSQLDVLQFRRFSSLYAEWVRENDFAFTFCDTLATRLEKIHSLCRDEDIDIKSDCIMSLLYMGTKHNRWYVEQKFCYLISLADDRLIKKLEIEFATDEEHVCKAVRHLEKSININRKSFPKELFNKLKEICE